MTTEEQESLAHDLSFEFALSEGLVLPCITPEAKLKFRRCQQRAESIVAFISAREERLARESLGQKLQFNNGNPKYFPETPPRVTLSRDDVQRVVEMGRTFLAGYDFEYRGYPKRLADYDEERAALARLEKELKR